MERFFRLRHDIYVEELGWREPSHDGLEKDQFDTEDAYYFLGFIGDELVAGSRLISTDNPHLLSEVFPHLCNKGGVIRDRRTAEWTRGFILPEYRDRAGIRLKAIACSAIVEYCLDEGIERVGGIQEVHWLPLWKRFGLSVERRGEPVELDGTWCVPAYFRVDQNGLANINRRLRSEKSNLIHHSPVKPFLDYSGEETMNSQLIAEVTL